MPKELLNEREFEIINILGANLGSNQRDLSRQTNLSLGMVNMLMRRLIAKGFIRIEQLNKRKVQYILTPKGFSEKMRKTVKYTLNTINSIGLIKNRIKEALLKLHQQGHRQFYIYGEADLTTLIEMVINELKLEECKFSVLKEYPDYELEGLLLIGKESIYNGEFNKNNRFDLIQELAKHNHFMGIKK